MIHLRESISNPPIRARIGLRLPSREGVRMNFMQKGGIFMYGFSGDCFTRDLRRLGPFMKGFLYFIIVYSLANVGMGWVRGGG